MSGRRSSAVEKALEAVLAGSRPSVAARTYGCHIRSVRRALAAFRRLQTENAQLRAKIEAAESELNGLMLVIEDLESRTGPI